MQVAWQPGASACNLVTAALEAADSGAGSVRNLGFIAARPRAGIVKSARSVLFLIALLLGPFGAARGAEYNGVDPGGSRYAELAQINTGIVDRLVTAWTYRTGDLARRDAAVLRRSKFEVTPILVDGRLLICTS